MLEWQRELYDPQTTAKTFADAVDAAEAGHLIALREVRDLLVMCKPITGYIREGGDRERYLSATNYLQTLFGGVSYVHQQLTDSIQCFPEFESLSPLRHRACSTE